MNRFFAHILAAIALSVLFVPGQTAFSQSTGKFNISGQIRERTEYTGKDFNSDQDNVWFHLLRTRLNVTATPEDNVRVFVQIQDSRVFGSEFSTLKDGSADNLDAHQAYLQLDNLFGSNFSARVGRQEIIIGNQRLVGPVGWDNIGRSFDGAVFNYRGEKASLVALAAKMVGSTGKPDSKNLFGVVGTYPFAEGQLIDALVLLDNDSTPIAAGPAAGERKLTRLTAGVFARGKQNSVDYEAEAYIQSGDTFAGDTRQRSSLSAYFLSGKVGYTLEGIRKFRIGGLYTIVSGDDDPTDNTFGSFNTLFATNHKFYGFMDYFVAFGGPHGLRDASLSLGVNTSDLLRLVIEAHQFTADQEQATGGSSFGQEVDFTGIYKYSDSVSIRLGLSAFSPDELMKARFGNDTAVWGYLMTTVNF
jgi:Alginate export